MEWKYGKRFPFPYILTPSDKIISFSAPLVSSKSWAILSSTLCLGGNQEVQREIASLTKIMTAYTALVIADEMGINIETAKIVTPFESIIQGGTTAYLTEGDTLSILNMLHAMLLPSGNDAAYAIAYHFGCLLITSRSIKETDPVDVFVQEMNNNAKEIGMINTNYANPHGLCDTKNKSTAMDVAKLSYLALANPVIKKIVGKKSHTCIALDINKLEKDFTWTNTNKLLGKGFNGLKTGVTSMAGPCLSASFTMNGEDVIVVLLASKTGEKRWYDARKLKDYYGR